MALDDLIARLEQDADLEVQAIARAAAAEVAAMAAATSQALSARAERTLAAQRAERQAAYRRQLADCRREHRARELAAWHAAIERVFGRALALMPSVALTEAWAGVWPALAGEALSYVPEKPCRVRCSSDVATAVARLLGNEPRVGLVEDPSLGPGLVVEALDGSVTVDATLAALLAERQQRFAIGLLEQEGPDAE